MLPPPPSTQRPGHALLLCFRAPDPGQRGMGRSGDGSRKSKGKRRGRLVGSTSVLPLPGLAALSSSARWPCVYRGPKMSVKNKKSKVSHTMVTTNRICVMNSSLTPEVVRSEACLDDTGPSGRSRFHRTGSSSGPPRPLLQSQRDRDTSSLGYQEVFGVNSCIQAKDRGAC